MMTGGRRSNHTPELMLWDCGAVMSPVPQSTFWQPTPSLKTIH